MVLCDPNSSNAGTLLLEISPMMSSFHCAQDKRASAYWGSTMPKRRAQTSLNPSQMLLWQELGFQGLWRSSCRRDDFSNPADLRPNLFSSISGSTEKCSFVRYLPWDLFSDEALVASDTPLEVSAPAHVSCGHALLPCRLS